ncbi:MAG: hypothetical protein ABFR62_09350 [Bacteroidota bacterium]
MTKFISAALLLFAVLFSSCGKQSESTAVITGYYLRDASGNAMGMVEEPNVKLNNGINDPEYKISIGSYPNPFRHICNIYTNNPSPEVLKKIVVTKAEFNKRASVSTNMPATADDIVGEVLIEQEFTNSYYSLDFSDLETGYYRVYVEINGELFYDNLKKTD